MAAAVPILLYLDPWSRLMSKEVQFNSFLQGSEDDPAGLQLLHSINSLRNMVCCKPSTVGTDPPVDATLLNRLAEYLGLMDQLVTKMEPEAGEAPLVTHWTSPLSGTTTRYYKVKGLASEMGLAAFLYASALRALALQMLSVAWAGSEEGADVATTASAASTAAEASTLLRRAAGVHTWLVDVGLARVAEKLPSERPAELLMSTSRVMCQVCLAEAQGIAAERAAQRGTSPALVAALSAGAWELWEAAAKALKDSTPDHNTISERLRRYLAASSAVARIRAYRHLAADLRDAKGQAGQAEAACVVAAGLLPSARMAADVDASWRQALVQEAALLEEVRVKCERERTQVTYQSIAKVAPDLPNGKVLVTPVSFSPAQESERVAVRASEDGTSGSSLAHAAPTALGDMLQQSLSFKSKSK